MRKAILLAALAVSLFAAGCNTVAGAGKNVSWPLAMPSPTPPTTRPPLVQSHGIDHTPAAPARRGLC